MSTPAQRMVAEQLLPHGVTDQRVLKVMSENSARRVRLAKLRRHAYEDRALAIDCGQTISQPLVVALIDAGRRAKTRTTSRWKWAQVFRLPGRGAQPAVSQRSSLSSASRPLAEHAAATLSRLGLTNVEVAVGDGSLGWPPEAPYQIIPGRGCRERGAAALIEQLAEGRAHGHPGGRVTHRAAGPASL